MIDLAPVQGVDQKIFSAQFTTLNGGGKEDSGLVLSGHDTQEDAIQAGIFAVGKQYGKVSTGSKVVFNKKYYNCGSRSHLGYRFTLGDFIEAMRKKNNRYDLLHNNCQDVCSSMICYFRDKAILRSDPEYSEPREIFSDAMGVVSSRPKRRQ